jgi:predicted membrane-bound mannosyltransferase
MSLKLRNFFLVVGIISYFASILIVNNDVVFQYKWFAFTLWIFSIFSLCIFFFQKSKDKKSSLKSIIKEDLKALILILILTLISRFIFLNIYPFNSIGDELRDGGWDAMRIAKGEIGNIFAYGRYESHGLIVPTFNSFFYQIFGESSLAFRVPSAILGSLDIFILYFLVRKYIGKRTAFIASFIMICLPMHLYYSRTETVVIFSSILATSIFFLFLNFVRDINFKTIGFLGLLLGFALNFHGSIKPVIFLAFVFTTLILFYKLFKKGKFQKFVILFGVLVVSIFIGFGPRVLFTTPDILFQTQKVSVIKIEEVEKNKPNLSTWDKISASIDNYPKSFLVYFYEPVTSHFRSSEKAILSFLLGLFFLIGLAIAFFSQNKYMYFLLIFVFTLPFTNSAITDWVNADHRLAPLLSLAAIFAALGIDSVMRKTSELNIVGKRVIFYLTNLVIAICIISTGVSFFINEPASYGMFRFDKRFVYQDFMLTQSINLIQHNPNLKNSKLLCFTSSGENTDYLNLLHIKEELYFFLPNSMVSIQASPKIDDSHLLYISSSCDFDINASWQKMDYCDIYKRFICPPDKSRFSIFSKD